MGLYRSQFISMIIMIALGMGVFVGFNMEWYSIQRNTEDFFESTGYADYRIVSELGYSEDDLEKIENITGVDEASRFFSVNVDVKDHESDTLTLTVTENENVSGVFLVDGEEYDENSKDGIWLSDKYAEANDIEIGDELSLVYSGVIEISGTVKGLVKSSEYMLCVRDETQLMPDYETHCFAYVSPAMYKAETGLSYYPQINVLSNMGKTDFINAVNDAFGKTSLVLTKADTISYSNAKGVEEEGQTMGALLPPLFLLIAVLTMVTTMHRLTAKEKTQIGTFKALGFKNKRITRHYTSYALIIGVVGTLLGIVLGFFIAWIIINPDSFMGEYFDIPSRHLYLPWFCILILVAVVGLLTLIGYLSVRQMLRGSAAEALAPYTPGKMKNMLIEKTKWFHNRSFGTRWNMRDTVRHKSRTAMSLLGVVGCMMIVVCALGLRDTMQSFVHLYYEGATNYTSRIYLNDEVTDDKVAELKERYEGDVSASISVQIEDKAISLDVFNVTHDLVRFPSEDTGYTEIGDDGAYICMRLAEEFNLSVGDSFTVSPYGSDDEYLLTVAGIVRSVSENIVITDDFAESAGIDYTIDSIYTLTEKTDIESDSAVKNILTKQSIMDSFDSFLEIMNTMIVVLIVAAAVLGIVVLYNLGVMSFTERSREMATLKVVGFKDKKIRSLLVGQTVWTTLAGAIIGLPTGIGVLQILINMLANDYEMKMTVTLLTCVLSLLLTFGVSLLVSVMVARKNKYIDMVEALKGAE